MENEWNDEARETHECRVRGDPFITFASRGGEGVQKLPKFANDSTDRLRENANKGEGVQNLDNLADVICASSLNTSNQKHFPRLGGSVREI